MLLVNYSDYVSESNYISNYFTTDKSTISTTDGLRYKLDTQAGKPQSYIFQQFKDVAKAVMPSLQVNESATINVLAGANTLSYTIINDSRKFQNYTYRINNETIKTVGSASSDIQVLPVGENRNATNFLRFYMTSNTSQHLAAQATTGSTNGQKYNYIFYNEHNSAILNNPEAKIKLNIDGATFTVLKTSDTNAEGSITQTNGNRLVVNYSFATAIPYVAPPSEELAEGEGDGEGGEEPAEGEGDGEGGEEPAEGEGDGEGGEEPAAEPVQRQSVTLFYNATTRECTVILPLAQAAN
jgi:hypothetical protein